jgi:hypothetical protein
MPELSPPTVRVHLSFLAAMAEFESEGRGGADDDTMIGGEICGYGPSWATRKGLRGVRAVAARPGTGELTAP